MRERMTGGDGTMDAHTSVLVVAIAPDATVQIKRLLGDETVLFDEPLH
jgi:hypothetical protein